MKSRIVRAGASTALAIALTAGLATPGYALPTSGTREAGAPITLTIADYWGGNVWYHKLLKTYEAQHPNVHIADTDVAQASFVSKVLTDAAGGSTPDLILGDNPDVPDFVRSGIVMPLNKLLPKAHLSPAQFYPGPMQAATWNHAVYGLPVGSNVELLFYNKGLLAKAHVAVPHTWAQLTAAAKKLNDPAKHVWGFEASGFPDEVTTWDWEPYLWQLGGSLTNVDSAAAIRSMTFYTSFIKDGLSPKSELTASEFAEDGTLFAEGEFALAEMGSWDFPVIATTAKKTGLSWGVTTLPTPKAGEAPDVPFGGEDWSIGKTNAAHEAAAWNFLKWWFTPSRLLQENLDEGYLPPLKSLAASFPKKHPLFAPIAAEMKTSRSRTTNYAYNYPAASKILWTTMGSIMDGSTSVQAGLAAAQKQLASLVVFK